MRIRLGGWLCGLVALFGALVLGTAASAQQSAQARAMNDNAVGVVSGGVNGTYVRIAADLATVLDGKDLRVLPILGKGSIQNMQDLLFLRGVDAAIVQSDALEYLRRQPGMGNLPQRVHYIAKLYNEEFHLLARADTANVEALRGRKVNVDVEGSGTSMTASVVFDALGVNVETTHFDQSTAVEKLKAGEIDALAYVAGKPATLFQKLAGSELHLVPLPLNPKLLATYLPSRFTKADYPNLIREGEEVPTLAVSAVLAAYNWPAASQRQQRLERFVSRFFDAFDDFLKPGRHPKWQEVSLSAQVPGWNRARAAQRWLDARGASAAPR